MAESYHKTALFICLLPDIPCLTLKVLQRTNYDYRTTVDSIQWLKRNTPSLGVLRKALEHGQHDINKVISHYKELMSFFSPHSWSSDDLLYVNDFNIRQSSGQEPSPFDLLDVNDWNIGQAVALLRRLRQRVTQTRHLGKILKQLKAVGWDESHLGSLLDQEDRDRRRRHRPRSYSPAGRHRYNRHSMPNPVPVATGWRSYLSGLYSYFLG
ncbi:hypothetical protein PIIN_10593 [Serendipita indica DSM 11827]|uniref:Uncharacterized protein n=1 Tax=Serendipita indica (strain DSM 11827) TaxID=1109443 RepID=G4TZ59_SERID|nr:hypothetical protein PIIN_10593 [Serendipita indica DSM 11827]